MLLFLLASLLFLLSVLPVLADLVKDEPFFSFGSSFFGSVVSCLHSASPALTHFVKNEDFPLITGLVSGFGKGLGFALLSAQFLLVKLPALEE